MHDTYPMKCSFCSSFSVMPLLHFDQRMMFEPYYLRLHFVMMFDHFDYRYYLYRPQNTFPHLLDYHFHYHPHLRALLWKSLGNLDP